MPDPVTIGTAVAVGVGASAIADRVDDDTEDRAILRDIDARLAALVRFSEVQREQTMYPIDLGPGIVYIAREPLRMERIMQSGDPGDEFGIMQGTGILFRWINVSGDPVTFDIPLLLTGDISVVNITTPASTAYRATMFGYRDRSFGIDRRIGA